MTEFAVTLANFRGSQKSDQGPVMLHFESADQQFIVALPPEQLTKLIAGAIAQLPLAMDETGKPAGPQIIAFPTTGAAAFSQPNGSVVIGLTMQTGGQAAFVLSPESYAHLLPARPPQPKTGEEGDPATHLRTPVIAAANQLLDAVIEAFLAQFPGGQAEGAVAVAVAELLRAADRPERNPVQDLQGVARTIGMELADLPPPFRQQLADLVRQQIEGGMNWKTPPGPHGAN